MWELDDDMREVHADRIRVRAENYRKKQELAEDAASRAKIRVLEELTDEFQSEVRIAKRAGMSVADIARAANMTRVTIYRALEKAEERKQHGKG